MLCPYIYLTKSKDAMKYKVTDKKYLNLMPIPLKIFFGARMCYSPKMLRKKVPLNSPQKSIKLSSSLLRIRSKEKSTVLGDIQGKSIYYNNNLIDLLLQK